MNVLQFFKANTSKMSVRTTVLVVSLKFVLENSITWKTIFGLMIPFALIILILENWIVLICPFLLSTEIHFNRIHVRILRGVYTRKLAPAPILLI